MYNDEELEDELSYSNYSSQRKIEYDKFLKEQAITLKLGETYLQESASWAKSHYKIIFVDDTIAVGIKVWCGIFNSDNKGCGTYEMFKANTGEKYNDSRLEYALKIIK